MREKHEKRIRSQRIRIKGRTGKFAFGGWLAPDCRSYLRVEDALTKRIDWIDGYALYRLAKAIVRRWEGQ